MTLTPTKPSSLYQIALEAHEIDGELAIALDLSASDTPEDQQQAEQLISQLLERAGQNSGLLKQKANAICHVHEALLGKAEFLRKSAEERLAKAAAEERAAERLLDYLVRTLSALNPGQKKFELPEYTVSSRRTESVDIAETAFIPLEYKRGELRIKFPHGDDAMQELISTIRELPFSDDTQIDFNATPSKTAIKAAIKLGEQIPGATLKTNTNWSIK
jgi:hypothetical protein